jgi:hypothetical protein
MKQLLLMALMLTGLKVQALDLELGAGQTQWSKPPNSQYWQQEFPHTFDLISPAYYVGVTDYLARGTSSAWYDRGHDGLRWRAGWLDLGNVRGEAWATSEDANYSGVGGGCYDMSRCRPEDLNKWDTYGRTKGVELSLSPEWVVGPGRVFVKVGAYIHRPRVNVRISRQDNDPGRTHYDYRQRINVGPTLGVGLMYQKATLSLSCYKINAKAVGQDDPTNDIDPVNIPQNSGSGACATKMIMVSGQWQF